MPEVQQPKLSFRSSPAGLMLQLFTIILLPLTLLLVAITFGSITIHQRAMRSLVGERDERAVRIAANALNTQIENRVQEINFLGSIISTDHSQPGITALPTDGTLIADFDKGIVVLDPQGMLLFSSGDRQLWETWIGNTSSWQATYQSLETNPGHLIVQAYPGTGEIVGLVLASSQDHNMIIGAMSVSSLVQATLSDLLTSGGQLSLMLVGVDHQIIYKVGDLTDQSPNHPGIAQALQGQSGITYVKVAGDEHVTAYSPIPASGWALITEESWESVATPTLRTSQVAPLVLVPAVLIMLLALYLGASRVVNPLRKLESKAGTLAYGDYESIQESVGGIAEIQHLQDELIRMSSKVRQAQINLHKYIGAITEAQEEERQRIARELHDDTLQALIALKQRVQLAQLELQPATRSITQKSEELDGIASMAEQTIQNLRRLTRALRPAYLEDLGLVPSLEALARETGQMMGIKFEFHCLGEERRLNSSVELALYRIAQEASSNIARHSHATIASVSIIYSHNSVALQVEDNGVGFDLPQNTAELSTSGHYGLLGMHERADLIGATLDVQTSPGKGTILVVTLPAQYLDQDGIKI